MKLYKLLFFLSQIISIICLVVLFNYALDVYPNKQVKTHVHKVLYVDRSFNQEEVAIIMEAAMNWTETTHHIAEIDVERLPTNRRVNLVDGIIIIKIDQDFPDVIVLDGFNFDTTLGYYNGHGGIPYISLITDRIDDYDYKSVVMHEIGHALGLRHVQGEEGMGTLMYPSVTFSSDYITHKDLEQFCSIYHCDVSKL